MADAKFMDTFRGRFIAFEGPDGSGKTTLCRRLASLARGVNVPVCEVRDPGGTDVGERIREILLDRAHSSIGVRCELLLFMASRAQLALERIAPALERGELVIADRFVASALVYQGFAGGLPADKIAAASELAIGGLHPDVYVVLDADDQTLVRRLESKAAANELAGGPAARGGADRIEERGAAFRALVRTGYQRLCEREPAGHLLVDASGDFETVWERVIGALRCHFGPGR